jgi:phosphopantothenoylcysteine decarboxylase/phosphopantothenate--cysteine ligase
VRILVTAGPTREYLDSVRFISNASSGRMGYAIAVSARDRGHEVVLISGPVALPAPEGVDFVQVVSAQEMLAAAESAFDRCDAAVMTAAVADFRPVHRLDHKAPKPAGDWTLGLGPTPDICATLGRKKGRRLVIGFAVQDEDPHARAENKMDRKQCDAIVLNGPETIGSPRARQQIKVAGEPWGEPFDVSKEEAADRIVTMIERLWSARRGGDAAGGATRGD